MQEQTSWSRYIAATCNGDLNTVIAEKVGVDPATIGRWRTGSFAPKPRQVVEYARAYGQSPIAALIGSGYLTPEEAGIEVSVPDVSLTDFSDSVLIDEVSRRLRQHETFRTLTETVPATTDIGSNKKYLPIVS